jgi:hypothetical protein
VTGIRLGFVLLAGFGSAGVGCRERERADSAMTAARADSLRLQIEVPARVPAGRPVPIVVRASNAGARRREIYLLGRTPTFDVTVRAEDGRLIWQRLQDSTVPAILQVRTLAPGEVLEARFDWDQRANGGAAVGPGRYTVRGVLLTGSPPPLETPPAALEVVAR